MQTLAVLPVKRFDDAKHRLGAALGRGSRRALAQAMFTDVIAALRRSRRIDVIAIVTADPAVEAAARSDRMLVLRDPAERGQSTAAARGVEHAVASGFDRVVLVASDTPLLEPAELDRLLDGSEAEAAVTIVPDRHGTGTNALVLCPPRAIAPAFGPDSRARHEAAARAAQVPHRVAALESLGHDVDTPEDLDALAAVLDRRRGLA
nr:2-phospho-L-lactate guanylyltransferase [Actinomycetota bacterium]